MADGRYYLEAPTITTPAPFGLLSVASRVEENHTRWLGGAERAAENCIGDLGVTNPCLTNSGEPDHGPKDTTDGTGFDDIDPTVLYLIRECRAVGDFQEAANLASKMFDGAEQVGLEKATWAQMIAKGVADGTDISLATAPSLAEAIGILEHWAGLNYAGRPTIHVPRHAISGLGGTAVERHGNHLETVNGSLVSSGSGYGPEGIGAAGVDQIGWVFVSGQVTIRAGAKDAKGPFLTQGTGFNNTTYALVERGYLIDEDCAVAGMKFADLAGLSGGIGSL